MPLYYSERDTQTNVINVKQYGALGNGTTDDTAAIQAAINGISNNNIIYFPSGTYKISDTASYASITFDSLSNIKIIGHGATIQAASGMSSDNGTNLVYFKNCSRFDIEGLIVDGNRAYRSPSGEKTTYNLLFEDCEWFTLRQVKSINSCIDGFVLNATDHHDISTYCKHFLIQNCEADNCWRQGMSIINGYYITVDGGKYVNTSGTLPEAGIDIEADISITSSGQPVNQNITIRNVLLSGNHGRGLIVAANDNRAIVVENCDITNNNGAADLAGQVNFKSNYIHGITDCSNAGIVQVSSSSYAQGTVISNNRFADCSVAKPCIYTHSTTSDIVIEGNTSNNCDHFLVSYAPNSSIVGNNVTDSNNSAVGFIQAFGACTISSNNVNGWLGRIGYVTGDTVIVGNNFREGSGISFAGFQFGGGVAVISNNTFKNSSPVAGYVMRTDSGSTVYMNDNYILNYSSGWTLVNAGSTCIIDHIGTGTPSGVLAASVGSVYKRVDGGSSTTLYIKESGFSTAGWSPK